MSKTVAKSIRNSEFQEKKNGDLAVLFFKESCPACRNFKPIWNRVAKGLKKRWYNNSLVYDEDIKKVAPLPPVRKIDVAKFANVQATIRFPSVPTVALYKRGHPPVFLITRDRSLPNILKQVEDYYKRHKLPPAGEYLLGNEYGEFPEPPAASSPKPTTPPTAAVHSATPPRDDAPPARLPTKRVEPREIRRPSPPKIPAHVNRPKVVVPEKRKEVPRLTVKKSVAPVKPQPTMPSRTASAASVSRPQMQKAAPEDEIFARLLAKLMKHKNKF